ncbi:dynein light chain type 1, putative [Eimeria necatrix]|uniref:Dynein light chain type 1, putative n=1 Tax=Eimeria necatrix TaxID=51315 RepID=U6MIS6_9EIME|nr:dynein light chain type 1, putative [Eimeria necatrix]CDJ63936.1 dynein light chain type 1, putative [Eimeria necatrix]
MFTEVAQPDEYQAIDFTVYKSAKVMSPPDMPDYMLDYTITKAKELLQGDNDFNAHEIAVALKRDLDKKWQPCWYAV